MMKRRAFLTSATATSAAALTAVTTPRAGAVRPETRPLADPDQQPAVQLRTDLITIAPTVDGMTLDGTLGDNRWGEPVWQEFRTFAYLEAVPDTDLHLAHDKTNLYLGLRVTGAHAASVSHLSCLVRAAGRYHAVTIQIRTATPKPNFDWGGAVTTIDTHRAQFSSSDDEATCEVAIPLAALGISGDPVGQAVGVNVVVDHFDQTAPASSLGPIRTSSNAYQGGSGAAMITDLVDEDRAAEVHLGQITPLADGRTAPGLGQPAAITLGYLDFTHKQLRVEVGDVAVADTIVIDWRGPGEQWLRLAETAKRGRTDIDIALEHPAPTASGQYQLRIGIQARAGADRVILATFDREDMITAGDQLPANRPHPPRGDDTVTPAEPPAAVAQLIDLVPDRVGFTFCGVPEEPALHPNATYTWSIDNPDKIIARATGTAYPNDNFAEDQVITVTNRLGDAVDYPFHEDAEGKRYFLSGHLWYHQRNYVYGQLVPTATDDPLSAARLLYRFAQVYQGWVPTNEYPWLNRPVNPSATPRNYYWGGTWYRWSIADLSAMQHLGEAIRLVERTDAFDVLSDEVGEDVRDLVINKTIKPSLAWFRASTRRYSNNDYPSYLGISTLGRALGDSSYVHLAVEWAREYLRRGFLFDGFWWETTLSYHLQSINGLFQVANALEGWSDAEGYESPRSGQHFTDLDLLADMAVLASSAQIPNLLAYPDGKLLPVADTWAYALAAQPDHSVGSLLLGAGGVARMSRGGISATGPFGIVQQFPDLEIIEQTAETKPFPASGTIQFEAGSTGQTLSFGFEVETADNYDLDLLPFHAGSYGRYEISIDDVVVGEHEFYDTASGVAEFFTLTRLDLAAGSHVISFHGVGKDDASTGYKMGVVSLALLDEAARQQRDEAEPPEQANPTQTYLLYTPKYGHNHYDPLSLALFAEGQELLPDLGYTHTIYRRWAMSTLAHNTVTVDSEDLVMPDGRDGGSIEIFDDADEAVQVVRAEYGTGYPQTSRYQRETWQIEHPDTDRRAGYLLDLFRVVGGDRHELTVNGDANRDAEMTTPITTEEHGPYLLPPGVEVTEPTTELDYGSAEGHYYGYIYVRDVERAELADGQFDVTLTTSIDGEPGSRAHLLGVAGPDTTLFLGRSPSLRATRVEGASGDTNDEVVKWTMPKLVLRRDGEDLHSDFVTVIEPYPADDEARITAVELLPHNGSEDDLAVRVSHADGTVDVIISTQTDESTVTAEGVTLTGKLGWVRLRDGAVVGQHVVGGTALTAAGTELTGTGAVTGTVTGTRRRFNGDEVDAIVAAEAVPEWVVGRTMVVTHPDGKTHGYPVKAVSGSDGGSVIELDGVDPGFEIADDQTSALAFTPFTEWSGETTFRIENCESAMPE